MPNAITRRAFAASAADCPGHPVHPPGRRRRADRAALLAGHRALASAQRCVPRFPGKIEAASDGQIKTKLFESGALFPDLQVVKAVVQGQVEMACPGTWTITGFVADADFSELPAFYGRPIEPGAQGDRRQGGQVRQ